MWTLPGSPQVGGVPSRGHSIQLNSLDGFLLSFNFAQSALHLLKTVSVAFMFLPVILSSVSLTAFDFYSAFTLNSLVYCFSNCCVVLYFVLNTLGSNIIT